MTDPMTDPAADPATLFARRPWRDSPAPPAAALAVPTMLTDEEGRFYRWLTEHWLARRFPEGGEVVDLGCFVGGSTARLAAGHAAAGRPGLIHAYDFFTVSEGLKRQMLYPRGIARFKGEDMLSLSRRLLAPWEDRVTFHRGDLMRRRWPADEPVAALVIDAAKSVALADHIAAQFFPALQPGRSIVVQQDFLHRAQPWLPAQMELLADHFQPLVFLPDASVSYLCLSVPGPAALAAARLEGRDDAALIALVRAAARRLDGLCPAERFERQVESLVSAPGTRVAWQFPQAPRDG
ncbi:hypothetical protein [Frigidibacter sp. MR17.24]|uniref:hypothetical protein n=1 Tax=Frigidibacter sp. MR17.24 TaxID=3127345 RepID=UPI003012A620